MTTTTVGTNQPDSFKSFLFILLVVVNFFVGIISSLSLYYLPHFYRELTKATMIDEWRVTASLIISNKYQMVVPILLIVATIYSISRITDFKRKVYINIAIFTVFIIHLIVIASIPYFLIVYPIGV